MNEFVPGGPDFVVCLNDQQVGIFNGGRTKGEIFGQVLVQHPRCCWQSDWERDPLDVADSHRFCELHEPAWDGEFAVV